MPLGSVPGVFNHALFAPGPRAESLAALSRRSMVVASEFDALQLQSLGARLAEREGLKPQAEYLKVAAVGDRVVDATTVRSLGQMPLVILDRADRAGGARIVEALGQELNLLVTNVPESKSLEQLLRTSRGDDLSPRGCLGPWRSRHAP